MNAAELSAAFESRELSPVEVTEACLGRIEALDSTINSFCHMDVHATETMAEASENAGSKASRCRRSMACPLPSRICF